MENDKDGLFLFLDFEKAFDSVEWNFLFKVLKKFDFGDNFISWVTILYTNPIFRIKNNGWISKTCEMSRGIRQGCPVSALLYLFIAEILAIKLKTNNDIKGIKIANMSTAIKNLQHADDVTLALRDMLSLDKAIETVKSFCDHAGSKVNLNKTQCILLGKLKDKHSNIGEINVTNDAVRCLGIFIGHDKEQCFDLNWKKN